jgi:hypothetical protein
VRPVSDDSASAGGIVEREGVFVVRDGKAVFVPVRVGISMTTSRSQRRGGRRSGAERQREAPRDLVTGPRQDRGGGRRGVVVKPDAGEARPLIQVRGLTKTYQMD